MAKQMTLGQMIETLERKDPEYDIRLDFAYFRPCGLHSYRGYYDQLAIDYEEGGDIKVGQFLEMLKDAVAKTYYGYKGGTYTMYSDTPMWVDKNSHASGTAVVDIRDCGWFVRIITAPIDD